jgi:hypothetical protein
VQFSTSRDDLSRTRCGIRSCRELQHYSEIVLCRASKSGPKQATSRKRIESSITIRGVRRSRPGSKTQWALMTCLSEITTFLTRLPTALRGAGRGKKRSSLMHSDCPQIRSRSGYFDSAITEHLRYPAMQGGGTRAMRDPARCGPRSIRLIDDGPKTTPWPADLIQGESFERHNSAQSSQRVGRLRLWLGGLVKRIVEFRRSFKF